MENAVFGQCVRHPERHPTGGFDLHQRLTARKQGRTVNRAAQREVAAAISDVFVKGDAEVAAVQRIEGFAFVGQKDRGAQRVVIRPEILDFVRNLGLHG